MFDLGASCYKHLNLIYFKICCLAFYYLTYKLLKLQQGNSFQKDLAKLDFSESIYVLKEVRNQKNTLETILDKKVRNFLI